MKPEPTALNAPLRGGESIRPRKRRTEDDAARRFLSEALEELDALDGAAAETEAEPPGAEARRSARLILTALAREFPRYYAVTLGDERDISIETDAGMGKGRGVLIVCDDEDVACYVTANGENTMRHYSHAEADALPDEFIRNALQNLNPVKGAEAADLC